jgi:hypothetical protein
MFSLCFCRRQLKFIINSKASCLVFHYFKTVKYINWILHNVYHFICFYYIFFVKCLSGVSGIELKNCLFPFLPWIS